MKYRIGLCAFVCCFAMMAQTVQMNLEQLADFVRSEIALRHYTDKQIAAYLKKVQLTEKLTDKTITDLEAQGAGPKTVEALQHLRDETVNRKPPSHDVTYSPDTAPSSAPPQGPPTATLSAQPAPIPPPDSVRQQQMLDGVKQYALSYAQTVPNFICLQVTRRYLDPNGSDHFRSIGTVLAQLSYNEGSEHYKVFSVDNKLVDTTMQHAASTGGAISTGEFESLMRSIFESKSEADFGWDHWGKLRGKVMAVFNYTIDSGHSSWTISSSGRGEDEQHIITAYRGLIYADPNTGTITRITFNAVDIPKSFPVNAAEEILDYDNVVISGQTYICPLKAELKMHAGVERSKNDIEFRNYRKFEVGSNIVYDAKNTPAPLSDSQTNEQSPATPAQTAKAPSGSSPWNLPTPPPPPPQ